MSEWQPIETAPKDGAWVLAYAPDSGWCEPAPFVLVHWGETLSEDFWWRDEADATCDPTHWMPLPAAPATPGET